jgi:FkbM family methyltransferase
MGEELRVSLQDPLAQGWYDHDWGDQAEIDALRRGRLRPGARVFDLGAHQGIVALVLARIVGEAGEVVAVEAERHNVRVAEENVRLNNATNMRIVHAAAADAPGRLLFSESLNAASRRPAVAGKLRLLRSQWTGLLNNSVRRTSSSSTLRDSRQRSSLALSERSIS